MPAIEIIRRKRNCNKSIIKQLYCY